MLDARLVVKEIEKHYRGKDVFVPFSGQFMPGKVYLFTQENGMGKSTLLKAILGLVKADGKVTFYTDRIAYIPEKIVLPLEMTSLLFLDILGEIKGLDARERAERIDLLARDFAFTLSLGKKIGELSKGMRQKVLIMCAFLRNEDIYLFDEAFSGLDQASIATAKRYIMNEKRRGATFLIVTHEQGRFRGLGATEVKLTRV